MKKPLQPPLIRIIDDELILLQPNFLWPISPADRGDC